MIHFLVSCLLVCSFLCQTTVKETGVYKDIICVSRIQGWSWFCFPKLGDVEKNMSPNFLVSSKLVKLLVNQGRSKEAPLSWVWWDFCHGFPTQSFTFRRGPKGCLVLLISFLNSEYDICWIYPNWFIFWWQRGPTPPTHNLHWQTWFRLYPKCLFEKNREQTTAIGWALTSNQDQEFCSKFRQLMYANQSCGAETRRSAWNNCYIMKNKCSCRKTGPFGRKAMCVKRADILDWKDIFMKNTRFEKCIFSERNLLFQRMAASGRTCFKIWNENHTT